VICAPDSGLAKTILEAIVATAGPPRIRVKASASQLHRCIRALVLEQAKDTPRAPLPARALLAFKVGHAVHELIQAKLDAKCEERWETPFVIGHSDARMGNLLIDFKTTHADEFIRISKEGPKWEHQLQVNWYAIRSDCQYGAVVYINKNGRLTDQQREQTGWKGEDEWIKAWRFKPDADLAQAYEEKAERMLKHVEEGSLPEYDEIDECRFCNVRSACESARREGR